MMKSPDASHTAPAPRQLDGKSAGYIGPPEVRQPHSPTSHSITNRLHSALLTTHPQLLIIAIAWIANFLHFTDFGYYEDDWYYFPTGFGSPLLDRFNAILPLMKTFFQGRPMLLFFETVFAYVGRACSSITAPYLSIFALFAASACLFYKVLRIRFPRLFCTIAALSFVLSPLTTVRQNLVIGSIMGPAFICLFLAILTRRTRPFVSYLLAIVALFTYESVFLLFLAAPFFERSRWRNKTRTFALHVGICLFILLSAILLRRSFGEQRMIDATAIGPAALAMKVIGLDLYYSARSFLTYLYAAWATCRSVPFEALVYLTGFHIWSFILFRTLTHRHQATTAPSHLHNARQVWWLFNGCMISLALVVLGFATIYFQTAGNPILLSGRDTRFSASAVPGSSMFIASVIMITYHFLRPKLRWAVWLLISPVFSVCFAYSLIIQTDYVRAWNYEKHLLSQLVLLTPDLEPNGLIVIRTDANPQPGFAPEGRVASIGWQRFGTIVSLKCLGDWLSSPEILFVSRTEPWQQRLVFGADGQLHWIRRESGSIAQFVTPGRIILLDERDDGTLSRSDDMVTIDGRNVLQQRRTNVALGKPARQSSTFGQFNAGYGLDGHIVSKGSAWNTINRSTLLQTFVAPAARTALASATLNAGRYTGFHTNYEASPWWQVDLGRTYSIQGIRIYNGQPRLFDRAASLLIRLSDDAIEWHTVYDNHDQVFGPEPLDVKLSDSTARYVRIQLAKPNWLHLEQVEVFGY